MPQALTDVITAGGNGLSAGGSVASRMLQSGFNVNALRTNATLRKDEWIQYDTAVVEVARKRLVAVADLLNAGLRYPVANALGITRVEWETVSDMTPAAVTMSGISESENDRVEFSLTGIPLPIIHKDFSINVRALEASRRTGQPLDTTQAQLAARLVSEQIESMLFNGATVLGSNNTIYGYTNAPQRNTDTMTSNWLSATGEEIVADILGMISQAQGDNMYGPYMLYVPVAVFTHFGDDYKAASDKTIIQRIREIPGIIDVKPTKDLPSGAGAGNTQAVLVQMTADVVDMIDGLQPTIVEWESHGGFVVHFKVLAIMVPRVRNDFKNQSGIVHWSSSN